MYTHAQKKGYEETLRDNGYVCGDDNTSIYVCLDSANWIVLILCSFLYTNYTSIKIEKKSLPRDC